MSKQNISSQKNAVGRDNPGKMTSANYYDQQMKIKKKDMIKINTNTNEQNQFNQMRHSVVGGQKQPFEQIQMQQNQPQQQSINQGVSNVKQVASKGATGRKGSLPLNYQQVPQQAQHQPQMTQQSQVQYMNSQNSQNRSSQQYLAQNNPQMDQNANNQFTQATGKGNTKSVKSHAKYFSQQNSPVGKEINNGASGIILSTSGAGIIGVDNSFHNTNARGLTNEMNNQTSHHTTGNFGSNPSQHHIVSTMNHQQTEPRVVKNYSQLSQHSNGSNVRDYKHAQYMQQLIASEQQNNLMKQTQQIQHQSNQSKLGNMASTTSHMKQVHSLGGPILSQYAGNQTIASNGNSQHSNYTQQTTQTFNASMNKHLKSKQQYDDNYLNGPLNSTTQGNKNNNLQQQMQAAKRAMNNQSQQINHNFDEQMRQDQMQAHHKRVVSSQQAQQINSQPQIQRSSTQTGNYSQQNGEHQSLAAQFEDVIECGKESTDVPKVRMGLKNVKSKTKAQTRPNSNQKMKQSQLQGSFLNENTLVQQYSKDNSLQNTSQGNSKKSKNVIQSAQTSVNERKTKARYSDSHQAKRQTPQTIVLTNNQQYNKLQQLYHNEQQPSQHNVGVASQNLVYYGANNKQGVQAPNDLNAHPSQGNIPMIPGNGSSHHSREKSKQQVVTVPQTMLHKSNKLMNNYLKQSTIQQPDNMQIAAVAQNNNMNSQQMYNKRMSTDQIMMEKDQLSFSMKKQSFHQRAETQLKNPNTPGLLPFAQQYEGQKENEILGGSIQGAGSASNSFLVMGQHQNSLSNMINTQNSIQNGNKYNISNGQNMKFNNTKSQKSSTSRLINSSGTTSNKFVQNQKGNNYPLNNNGVQNSADRIPISQRSDHISGVDTNTQHIQSVNINDMNYGGQKINILGGVITSNSSKQLIKNQTKNSKLNTLSNPQYPYSSSSTKSNKTLATNQQQINNLSIAQIFQQKGLNYKGPSKVGINNNTTQNNTQTKIAQRMGINGVIVHTKGGIGIKGSLTTSANTAQNSPRSMIQSKQGMYIKNQQNNLGSIRKKPSTASIAGASIGPHSQVSMGHKKNSTSNKFNNATANSNLRTTSHGTVFKKVSQQSKSGIQSRDDSPIQYQDEVEVTEIAHFDNTDRIQQLEPSKMNAYKKSAENYNLLNNGEDENINLLQNGSQKRTKAAYKNQKGVGSQNGVNKKQLIIGTQPSSQYIADNGGTGSNPVQQHHHQKAISQHDFYSQNIQPGHMINPNIPQKKNQHSNSLGNMQQLEMLKNKHMAFPMSGPHPTPKVDKQGNKFPHAGSQKAPKNLKQTDSQAAEGFDKYKFKNDDQAYQKQLMDNDDYQVDGPLITEEEEQEIRQVASDINEKAFYGKILKAKQIISDPQNADTHFKKLSPRSQEIASVMKEIHSSFRKSGSAPDTDINYYRVGKMLGRGAFGKVNLAMHKLVRKLVALKSLNKECLTDEVQKHKLMKEVNLLLKMRHDHVVKIYETIETKKHIIIVMELCAGGDLLNYVRKRRRLKEPYAKKIFKQIIEGLQYIHSKFVGHRDIKLDNILLDGKGSVKIADFGVSKQCQPGVKMREQCGTPAYIAPEILKNKNGYSFNVDLWSAGVVLFAMLYGTVPFKAASMEELHSLILRGVYTLKEDISQEARDMLRGLLEINPHKRLTIPEILDHEWLKDYDDTLQLFNDQEREMIKKEYTYNDPSRYNRNENEEPVDCFTEHNIDSVYNTLKNASEKSIILAPFNSTQSEDFEMFKKRIQPMMNEKNNVIRLSRLCREIDRQYEFNNNGQLDNGVYHKQINNTNEDNSEESDDSKGGKGDEKKKKKKQVSDDEDDESKFQVIQCTKSQGQEFLTEDYSDVKIDQRDKHGRLMSRMQDLNLLHQSTMGTKEMIIDHDKVQKLVQFGYPYEYITECLQENYPNYCSSGYYLLQMDQNYC